MVARHIMQTYEGRRGRRGARRGDGGSGVVRNEEEIIGESEKYDIFARDHVHSRH